MRLLAPLAPPHIRDFKNHVPGYGCRVKTNSTKARPWLEALKSLEGEAKKDEKSTTNTALTAVDQISESLVQLR